MKSALGTLLLVPALLGAQRAPRSCTPYHTTDSLDVIVSGQLTPFDTSRALPSSFTGLFMQEVADRLKVPRPFVMSTYFMPESIPGVTPPPRRGYPGINAMVAITVQGGRVKPELAVSSAVGTFDRALLDAIESIGRDTAVPPLPSSIRSRKLELRLRINTGEEVDSGHALFRVRVPLVSFASEPALRPGGPGLRYPEELRRANLEGSTLIQFVIDERGETLEGSIRVIRANHLLFAKAAVDFLRKARYVPVTIGSCPVPVVVRQPFNFTLRR